MSTKHSIAAAKFLKDRDKVNHHNQTFWSVRVKRDKMRDDVPEWEELREMASELKLYSNSHLDELLVEFEKTLPPMVPSCIGLRMLKSIVILYSVSLRVMT